VFLHICDGLWLGTKGILITAFLIIAAAVGFGWWWGTRSAESYRIRRNLLLYGKPKVGSKNIFHQVGDIWNFLFVIRR
jgi:hypothetical protein